MKFDYDLVIIGNTYEAIYAAFKAINLKARVALVQNPLEVNLSIYESFKQLYITNNENFFVNDLYLEQNYYNLASLGVDIIFGQGKFNSQKYPIFIVNDRQLKARNYLIATGTKVVTPNIQELDKVGCLTIEDVYNYHDLNKLPNNLAVIGNNPQAIELSQTLAKLNKNIHLIISGNRILPYYDNQASRLIQAHLEAERVKVFTSSPWQQIKKIEGRKWLQVGSQVINVEEVILLDNYQPNLTELNLESLGIKFNKYGFPLVNKKLQTTNANIYICGNAIGGYSQTNIAEHEADIAVKHALFLSHFQVNYNYLTITIFTEPNVAQVGMTETQAKKYYGDDVQTICEYFKNLPWANITNKNTGFCKINVLKDGTILGAVIVGENATEIIEVIALAMAENIRLQKLANFSYPYTTSSKIITKTAQAWELEKLKCNKILNNLLETWFNWRKT